MNVDSPKFAVDVVCSVPNLPNLPLSPRMNLAAQAPDAADPMEGDRWPVAGQEFGPVRLRPNEAGKDLCVLVVALAAAVMVRVDWILFWMAGKQNSI